MGGRTSQNINWMMKTWAIFDFKTVIAVLETDVFYEQTLRLEKL